MQAAYHYQTDEAHHVINPDLQIWGHSCSHNPIQKDTSPKEHKHKVAC